MCSPSAAGFQHLHRSRSSFSRAAGMFWKPAVLVGLLMLGLGPTVQELFSFPSRSMYKEEDLVGLKVPDDATILVLFKKDGPFPGAPPIPMPVLCELLEKQHRCMKLEDTDATYEGKNCDEDHCYMKRPDDTDSCILSSTHSSIDIDIKNLTRGVTCNQDTGSDPVIKPTKPVLEPARNNGQRRIPTSSPEAEVFVWEPCFRGRFMKVVRVQFPERPAKNYTCNANAVCVDTVLRARGVCFTTEDPLLAHDDGVKNSATLFTLFFAFAVASVLHLL